MKVLIDMPIYEPALDCLVGISGINVQLIENPDERLRPLPSESIRDCDILFCTTPPKNHIEMARLKLIQIASVGYTQVVGQDFGRRGIKICNARGVFDVPIAEWNISMIINLTRNIRALIKNQEERIWDRSTVFQREVRGLVVGIWGYGGIGRETARLAKALGMRVHVLHRSSICSRENIYNVQGTGDYDGILPDQIYSMENKAEFLSGLDFLIMAIPENSDTKGIVGEAELRMLPSRAFILNPARGNLIQENAFIKSLREGWIAGAAIDTHYFYPLPPEHPLWSMPNVIMTPHISGSSGGNHFLERIWDIFIENIKRFKNNEVLLNQLSPALLK